MCGWSVLALTADDVLLGEDGRWKIARLAHCIRETPQTTALRPMSCARLGPGQRRELHQAGSSVVGLVLRAGGALQLGRGPRHAAAVRLLVGMVRLALFLARLALLPRPKAGVHRPAVVECTALYPWCPWEFNAPLHHWVACVSARGPCVRVARFSAFLLSVSRPRARALLSETDRW